MLLLFLFVSQRISAQDALQHPFFSAVKTHYGQGAAGTVTAPVGYTTDPPGSSESCPSNEPAWALQPRAPEYERLRNGSRTGLEKPGFVTFFWRKARLLTDWLLRRRCNLKLKLQAIPMAAGVRQCHLQRATFSDGKMQTTATQHRVVTVLPAPNRMPVQCFAKDDRNVTCPRRTTPPGPVSLLLLCALTPANFQP